VDGSAFQRFAAFATRASWRSDIAGAETSRPRAPAMDAVGVSLSTSTPRFASDV